MKDGTRMISEDYFINNKRRVPPVMQRDENRVLQGLLNRI